MFQTLSFISPQNLESYIYSLDKYEIGKTYVVQVTYDGKEMKLYVNNKLQNTIAISSTIGIPSNNTIVMLGSNPRGTSADGCYFKGTIHSARMYDRALTLDELYKNYNSDEKRFIGIIRKEATLKEATLTGTITSTTNSIIYNDIDANLTLRDGVFILNKSGSSSKYLDLIENDGTLNIKENANLIVNSSYNNVINNKPEGKLVTTNPTLNIKNSYSNGIYNQSKKQDSFSGLKINSNNSNNTNGINTITNKDIEISDVEIKGSYNAGIYIGNGKITINDITVSGSSNIGIDNYGTLLINNGIISTTSTYGISNAGILTVEYGTITGQTGIYNHSDNQKYWNRNK